MRTLEVLRQPLEDKVVTISRSSGSLTFPANFMLIGAMNPCPWGHIGSPKVECICASEATGDCLKHLSDLLPSRIDPSRLLGSTDLVQRVWDSVPSFVGTAITASADPIYGRHSGAPTLVVVSGSHPQNRPTHFATESSLGLFSSDNPGRIASQGLVLPQTIKVGASATHHKGMFWTWTTSCSASRTI